MTHRECGDCNECCILLRITELDKEADVACEHLSNHRCSIYDDRPRSCRKFECLWLKGEVPEDLRPDRSGVMISDGFIRRNGSLDLYIHETREGAVDAIWETIIALKENRSVFIIPTYTGRLDV